MADLRETVSVVGDDSPATVLGAAHSLLSQRLRIAHDLEVLVLREDVGLSNEDTAAVMGLAPEESAALYAEALAVLEEDMGAPAATEEPEAPDETATPEATEAPEEPAESAEAKHGWESADEDREDGYEGIRVISSGGPSRAATETTERPTPIDTGERPGERRRRFPALIATVVLLAALAVALQAVGGPNGEEAATPGETPSSASSGTPTTSPSGSGSTEPAAGGSPTASPSPVGCQQAVCISSHRLVSEMNGSTPGKATSTFSTDDDVRLWMSYELGTDQPVRVSVVWRRGGEVLYELRVRLPRAEQTTQVILDKREQDPGDYEVDVTLGDQPLFKETFTVTKA